MHSIPLYIYEKEQRYGIFVSLLLRGYFPSARATKKQFKVSDKIIKSVRTLTDLTCFLTSIHAGRPMKVNKEVPIEYCQGRRLKKIGKSTGTTYKTTVSRRVKNAVKKFGLQKFHRYQPTEFGNMQIENAYYFGVDYIFNVYNKFICQSDKSLKNKKDSKGCTKTIEFYNLTTNGKKESSFSNGRGNAFSELYGSRRSIYCF